MSQPIRMAVALAVLGASPLLHAQNTSSVNLFGRMDLGIQHVDNGGENRTTLDSGTYTASRLGFRGREDLGGGNAAIFHLESGLNASAGEVQSPGKFFNRGSYVGLTSNSLGTLTLGRQYVPIFWPFLFGEQAGRHRLHGYSAVQSVQRNSFARIDATASPLTQVGTLNPVSNGQQVVGITSAFEDGLIVYKTPDFGPVSATVGYGMGKANAPHNDGRVFGANVQYNDQGRYLGFGYNRKNGVVTTAGGTSGQTLTEYLISGLYPVGGGVNVWGNVHPWSLKSGAETLKGRDAMVGVSYTMPSGMLWANYANKSISNCNGCGSNGFGIGYQHHLSARTEAYVSLGRVSNGANAAASINGNAPSAPGKAVNTFAVGLAHTF